MERWVFMRDQRHTSLLLLAVTAVTATVATVAAVVAVVCCCCATVAADPSIVLFNTHPDPIQHSS
jgi:hypothetical protein